MPGRRRWRSARCVLGVEVAELRGDDGAGVDAELVAEFLFLRGDELVELRRGRRTSVPRGRGRRGTTGSLPRDGSWRSAWMREADAAAFEGDDRFFHRGERADELRHPLAFDEAAVAGVEDAVAEAEFEELGLHFLFGLHVVGVLLAADDAEQRRLGDVDVALRHELVHLAVEEGEQQRANVRAVDVGVGHDDDPAVATLAEVLILADADADGGDHAADFFVGEDFVFARLVGVDDLAAQRQDRLELAQAAAFGRAAGRVTFDEVQFALVDVFAGAVAELAGQAAAAEDAFAVADELLGLAGRFAGFGGEDALLDRSLWRSWDSLRGTCARYSPKSELTMPSTSLLPSLVLVWPSNCGCGHADS